MTTYRTACYCGLGPGTTSNNLPLIQKSGLTTVIEFALHVGRLGNGVQQWGDFVFNNGYPTESYPFIRNGNFNPYNDPDVAAWPNDLGALKHSGGVKEIYFSIGGWGGYPDYPVKDFATIQYMLDNGMKQVLVDNFTALKNQFPAIDGFDLDCEEFGNSPGQFYPQFYPTKDPHTVGQHTVVQLCEILFGLGFKVTFCPYDNSATWQGIMQQLCTAKTGVVSWWNLQCYAGGSGNLSNLASWLQTIADVKVPDGTTNGTPIGKNAAAYLVPGLSVQNQDPYWPDPQCPAGEGGMCPAFVDMNQQSKDAGYSDLAGGFLWDLDGIVSNTNLCSGKVPTLGNYVNAITSGLTNKCP